MSGSEQLWQQAAERLAFSWSSTQCFKIISKSLILQYCERSELKLREKLGSSNVDPHALNFVYSFEPIRIQHR